MVDNSAPSKNDEEYPLLKVDSGGGDNGRLVTPPLTPGWNVTCSSKRSLVHRWPEIVFACWLTGMLVGLFILVLYGLGLGMIRRQPILIVAYNNSRPATNVYYHQIVRGRQLKMNEFSTYLANMATFYSSLRFNMIILLDDSQSKYWELRPMRLFNKLVPYHNTKEYNYRIDDVDQNVINQLKINYPNVNITILPLSRYMAMTPLRYKWKGIPSENLLFYLRVYSVWKNAGISMDLAKFKNKFVHNQPVDWKIEAILKQHNNGIKTEEYRQALGKLDQDKQNDIFSMVYEFFNQILNKTESLLNFPFSGDIVEKDLTIPESLVRTHRSKRELPKNETYTENMKINKHVDEINKIKSKSNITLQNMTQPQMGTFININQTTDKHNYKGINNSRVKPKPLNKNISVSPHFVVLYDISMISDVFGPSYISPNSVKQPLYTELTRERTKSQDVSPIFLSIDSDGSFIAASSKQHPFLTHIISKGCQRAPPEFSIQDAIITQCSNIFREDVYCNNVYIL